MVEITTPSFPRNSLLSTATAHGPPEKDDPEASMATPVKKGSHSAAVTSAISASPASVAVPGPTPTIDELVALSSDLHTLQGWMISTFAPYADAALGISGENSVVG